MFLISEHIESKLDRTTGSLPDQPSERPPQEHQQGRNEDRIRGEGHERPMGTPTPQNNVNEQHCPINKKCCVIFCISIYIFML